MLKQFFRFLNLVLCCLPVFIQAQEISFETEKEEDHSSFMAFRIGSTIPGHGFNETNRQSPQITPGFLLALEGAWLPHRNIGAMLSMQYNNFQPDAPDGFGTPGYITGQGRQSWNTATLLGGLYLSKPFFYWELEGRFLLGPGKTQAFEKFYERQVSPYYEQFYSYNAFALWYQAGISARLDKNPGWSMAMNYDFNFTQHPVELKQVLGGAASGVIFTDDYKSLQYSVISFSLIYSIPHY